MVKVNKGTPMAEIRRYNRTVRKHDRAVRRARIQLRLRVMEIQRDPVLSREFDEAAEAATVREPEFWTEREFDDYVRAAELQRH